MMPENFPAWLTHVCSAGFAAVLTWLLTRRFQASKADHEDASTVEILNGIVKDLMRQIRAYIKETHVWQAKLTTVEQERDQHARMAQQAEDLAAARLGENRRLRAEADIIIEEMSHLSYIADGNEADSIVARRFRAVKAAAARLKEVE